MTRKRKRETVTVDGLAFSVSYKNLNTEKSPAELKELASKEALDAALKYIKHLARSEAETEKYLRETGFSNEEVQVVIDRLKQSGFINDKLYLKLFIENYQKNRPYGKYALIKKLLAKGISRDLINTELEDYYSVNNPADEAFDLVQRRMYRYEKDKKFDKIKKITAYLYGRGYAYEVIESVLSRLQLDSSD